MYGYIIEYYLLQEVLHSDKILLMVSDFIINF